MSKVEELEQDIMALTPAELAALREWFQGYLAEEWDKQIDADAKAGKLDDLARKALTEHKAGRSKPL